MNESVGDWVMRRVRTAMEMAIALSTVRTEKPDEPVMAAAIQAIAASSSNEIKNRLKSHYGKPAEPTPSSDSSTD